MYIHEHTDIPHTNKTHACTHRWTPIHASLTNACTCTHTYPHTRCMNVQMPDTAHRDKLHTQGTCFHTCTVYRHCTVTKKNSKYSHTLHSVTHYIQSPHAHSLTQHTDTYYSCHMHTVAKHIAIHCNTLHTNGTYTYTAHSHTLHIDTCTMHREITHSYTHYTRIDVHTIHRHTQFLHTVHSLKPTAPPPQTHIYAHSSVHTQPTSNLLYWVHILGLPQVY